ncbi:MAG: FtsW/RodA/SpoVE family cell cycle protein [Lachnospiraceae bacterium]
MLKKYNLRNYNFLLVLVLLVLSGFGALMINSASDMNDCIKQIAGACAGFVIMVVVSLIDYNFILKFYWLIYIINAGLLALCRIAPFGTDLNTNAYRWIEFGPISIQPAEFAKILLILFLAKFLTVHRERISQYRFLGVLTIVLVAPLYLIYKQPDLSTTLLIVLVMVTMIYCSGLKYKNIFVILLCVIPIVVTGLLYIQSPDQVLLRKYQVNRIMSFIEPENPEYNELKYQQDNAVKAIGSGQLYGKGYNNTDSNSVKNGGFIAEAESDFIFAVVGEELGFIGACFLILLLAFLVIECIIISIYAKDFQGRLICCGYAALIAFSTFINIGVVTEILPNTGLPLPFMSKGLSSLIALFGGAGVVLNVGLQKRNKL